MENEFVVSRLPELHFGQRKIERIPLLVNQFGNNCLIVTGKHFIKSLVFNNLVELLKKNNLNFWIEIIEQEPDVEIVDNLVLKYSNNIPNVVVAIGGGSVLDAGKAISAMLPLQDTVYNYLEGIKPGKIHDGRKVPFIACSTTSGTGSEATKNAVISSIGGGNGYKRSLRHNNFVPNIAIIDPLLSLTCPPNVTAASGLDAFVQLFESYISTASNKFTDILAYEGMQRVVNWLNIAYTEDSNIEARANMAYSAYLSGVCLANAGLGVVHGFASSIATHCKIPHGVICGTLLGVANEMNINNLLDSNNDAKLLHKYANVGKLFSADKSKSDYFYVLSLTDQIHKFIEALNIPLLGTYGIKKEMVSNIVAETSLKNNPVLLNTDELAEILNRRI